MEELIPEATYFVGTLLFGVFLLWLFYKQFDT